MKSRLLVVVYILLSLIAIIVLSVLLAQKNDSENYKKCICTGSQGGRGKVCQKPETSWQKYQNGLTEYSDFAKMQQEMGGPKWSTVSPGDYDFPLSNNCYRNS